MGAFGLPVGTLVGGEGQFFLMLVYGFILFRAAVFIGEGSEKLLLLYGPGIVGGLVIPILGAIPDAAIVLVSGLQGNAQCTVAIGVGTLAGSTIMLLTFPFAMSLFVGYRDVNEHGMAASYANGKPKCEDPFHPKKSCVTTFKNTTKASALMMMTTIFYLPILIPALVLKNNSLSTQAFDEHYPALVQMILCAIGFVAYGIFQLRDSNAQLQQEMKQQKLKFLKWKTTVGTRVAGTKNAIRAAFEKFDTDGNGTIDRQELQDGFACLGLELDRGEVTEMMTAMDEDDDTTTLTFAEFEKAVSTWSQTLISRQNVNYSKVQSESRMSAKNSALNLIPVNEEEKGNEADEEKKQATEMLSNQSSKLLTSNRLTNRYLSVDSATDDNQQIDVTREDPEYVLASVWKELQRDDEEEEQFLELSDAQLIKRAILELLLGTLIVVIFSDPMVAVINNFAISITVPAFYVSFIITPIASNASEIYSAIAFSSKKSTEGISMGVSALYGAACMNSTLVLGIFAALIYTLNLEWTFITETLVIIMTMLVVGFIGLRQTIFVWQGFLIIGLFPLSLILVAVLDPVLDDVSCVAK
jgi:Ca2+/Na+ antiporter